ncbi:MAG: DUF47 family protein [Chloroflexota bacterium]|nr:DUF47 family protein [Chloroflexota bacterium]
MPQRRNRFRRVDPTYYTLFQRSGAFAVMAADALHVLFQASTIDETTFRELDDIEHRADSNTHDLLTRLERNGRAPFPEAETRVLVTELDEIVDRMKVAGKLAILTGVTEATPVAAEMAELLTRIAREVASLLEYLEQGEGFRPYVARIHELENEGDRLWERGYRELFDGSVDPLTVMRWKDIYAVLEGAIDSCEISARLIQRAITR